MSDEPFVWSDADVRRALGLNPDLAREGVEYTGVTTDSREVREGDLFVALEGERFDGHEYAGEAVASGAVGAVVSKPPAGSAGAVLYPVDDTLKALADLARHRRAALDVPVIGVTGSSGKTGTKELLRGALSRTLRVHATRGNLNNRVGMPLTVLETPPDAEVVVLEMGTNEPGEIGALAGVARPGIGILTTVSESHLEGLGSVEGVMEEKLDLLRNLAPGGIAIVGDDPPELAERAREIVGEELRVAGWSARADEDLRPVDAEMDHWGRFRFRWRGERVSLRIPGRHPVQNALLALAAAEAVGVAPAKAAAGIGAVEPAPMRGEIREVGGLLLLLDCYNANPQSVRAALDLLATHPSRGRKVAVLGTMLELGERSGALHREVLEEAASMDLDLLVLVGTFAGAEADLPRGGPERISAAEPEDTWPLLRERLEGGEVVLLKASRGVELERLVPLLERDFGEGRET